MNSLRNKILSGVFWTFSQQISVKLVSFGIQIVLARMLLPEAFGLIAMLQIFISVGNSLMDSGMTSSLIRTSDPNEGDYSTVFFINLFSSIFLYGILFISAPFIATFYRMPLLTLIVRIYGLSFIINALVAVQTARLTKNMNFKLQMFIEIPSVILSGLVGVILAYQGYGVWSLVWMNLIYSFIFMLQHWFRTDWRPHLIIDFNKLKNHLNFGYKLTLIGIGNAIYDNIYSVIIGKFFSATQLGFYNRATSFQYLPAKNIGAAMQKVTYSAFSSIQHDDEKLKSLYKKIMQQALFWITPLMVTLCIIAEPLFRLVLTEKWLPAVPYFQLLTVAGILYPINQYNLNIIWVKGRSNILLKLNICEKIILTAALIITVPLGITAMVIAKSLYSIIALFINSHYSGKFINYPLREQINDMLPVLILSSIVGIICYYINQHLVGYQDWTRIAIIFTISGICYLSLSHLLKISPYLFLKRIIFERLFKLSKN